MKLSIIIPVYNEGSTILEILKLVDLQKIEGIEKEVVVVDDGSTDKTLSFLEFNDSLYDVLIKLPFNLGKGGAVIEGLKAATGDFILFQDADLEYNPNDYVKLIYPVIEYKADIVIGSRLIAPLVTRVHYFWNKIGNKLITLSFNLINNTTFTDIYSCYFLFRKDLIDPNELKELGWSQQAEILSLSVKRGKVFYEVPISYHGRTKEEGKKIRAHHILGIFKSILMNGLFNK